MDLLKKFINKYKDLFLYQFTVGYNAIINLLAIVFFTRIMTTEELGLYFYSIAIINFLSIVIAFSFQQGISRFNPGKNPEVEIKLLSLYTILTVVGIFIFYSFVMAIKYINLIDIDLKFFSLITFGLLSDSIFKIMLSYFQAHKKVSKYKTATILMNNVRWFLGFYLIYFLSFGYEGLIIAFILGEIISVLLLLPKMFLWSRKLLNKVKFSKLKVYIKYGVPLMGYGLITYFKPLLINEWIKINEGENIIGLFNANFIFGLNVIGLLTTPFLLFMQPIMVENFSKNKSLFFKSLNTFLKMFITSSNLLFLMYVFFQEDIINLVIGSDFRSGSSLILFGIFSAILNGFILILIKPYEMERTTKAIFKMNVINFVVFCLLGYFFYKHIGMVGIAQSYILSNLITVFFLFIIFNNQIDFNIKFILELFLMILFIFLIFFDISLIYISMKQISLVFILGYLVYYLFKVKCWWTIRKEY